MYSKQLKYLKVKRELPREKHRVQGNLSVSYQLVMHWDFDPIMGKRCLFSYTRAVTFLPKTREHTFWQEGI